MERCATSRAPPRDPGRSADHLLDTSATPASSLSTAVEPSRRHVMLEGRSVCAGEEIDVARAKPQREGDALGGCLARNLATTLGTQAIGDALHGLNIAGRPYGAA
jgi:hypothetical protein